MPKIIKRQIGVQGKRIKLLPEQEVGVILSYSTPVNRGTVIGAGKESKFRIGDKVVVSDWLVERCPIGDDNFDYYVPDEAILEVL
jgi:hypothetical protein